MTSDYITRIYVRGTKGKYKGKFAPLDLRYGLKVSVVVSGFGQKKTYPIDIREFIGVMRKRKVLKGKRLSEPKRKLIKDKLKIDKEALFKRYVKEKVNHLKKTVVIGRKENSNLEYDTDVDLDMYWNDRETRWIVDFSTSYHNHPTFILLALGMNEEFNRPRDYAEVNVKGELVYHSALAKGVSDEVAMKLIEPERKVFEFNFFDALFKVEDYWLIPPQKGSTGITPVGMTVYKIRSIFEDMGYNISGSFQRKSVKQTPIEYYQVHLEITGIKAKNEKPYEKFVRNMKAVRELIKKHKYEVKEKERLQKEKKREFEKKQKGWRYTEERGFEPKKGIDFGRYERISKRGFTKPSGKARGKNKGRHGKNR